MPTNTSQQCKYKSHNFKRIKGVFDCVRKTLLFLLRLILFYVGQLTNIPVSVSLSLSLFLDLREKSRLFCSIEFSPGHVICFGQGIISRSQMCSLLIPGEQAWDRRSSISCAVCAFLSATMTSNMSTVAVTCLVAGAKTTVRTWSSHPTSNGHMEWATAISELLVIEP